MAKPMNTEERDDLPDACRYCGCSLEDTEYTDENPDACEPCFERESK